MLKLDESFREKKFINISHFSAGFLTFFGRFFPPWIHESTFVSHTFSSSLILIIVKEKKEVLTDRQKEGMKLEEEKKEKEKMRKEEFKRAEFLEVERRLQDAIINYQNQVEKPGKQIFQG